MKIKLFCIILMVPSVVFAKDWEAISTDSTSIGNISYTIKCSDGNLGVVTYVRGAKNYAIANDVPQQTLDQAAERLCTTAGMDENNSVEPKKDWWHYSRKSDYCFKSYSPNVIKQAYSENGGCEVLAQNDQAIMFVCGRTQTVILAGKTHDKCVAVSNVYKNAIANQ